MTPRRPSANSLESRALRSMCCQERMFLICLCLSDEDVDKLEVWERGPTACNSTDTVARVVLHQLVLHEERLHQQISDILDLRHLEQILFVRDLSHSELLPVVRNIAMEGSGPSLAGLAWALMTDPRAEIIDLGQRLYSECSVRGLQLLGQPDAGEN